MPDQKQLRAPPAFAVYAADDLARVAWYMLSAGERGLKASMDAVYWVDHYLPREPRQLARALRLPEADVVTFLSPAVLAFFRTDEQDSMVLHSVELERQLNNVRITREKQSIGGQFGAAKTNDLKRAKRKAKQDKASRGATSTPASQPASTPAGQVRVPDRTERTEMQEQSLGKQKKDGDTPSALAAGVDVDSRPGSAGAADPWIKGYSAGEPSTTTADEYRRRSRGS